MPTRYLDPMFEVKEEPPIVYSPNPEGGELHFRGFHAIDDKEKLRPLIIWLPGGGGTYDTKGDNYGNYYASLGYVFVALEARVGNEKLGVSDVCAAIRYFRANAEKYHVNPEWIFTSGVSKGSQITMNANMAALSLDDPFFTEDKKVNKEYPEYPSTVLANAPVSGSGTQTYKDFMRKTLCAPSYGSLGSKDEMFPLNQVQKTFDLMVSLGIPSVLTVYPGAGHQIDAGDKVMESNVKYFYPLFNKTV